MRGWAVLWLVSLAPTLGAQSGVAIQGQSVDMVNAGIGGATIRVLSESTRQRVQAVQSEEDGRFEVQNLDSGEYLLVVSAPGFEEKQVQFKPLRGGIEEFRKIQLEPLDCDAPSISCDFYVVEPFADAYPVSAQKHLTIRSSDAVDLKHGLIVSLHSADASLQVESKSGGLFLTPLKKVALARPCAKSPGCCPIKEPQSSVRIDGLGLGSEFFFTTGPRTCSKIFLTAEVVPGAESATIYLVSRADRN